MNSQFKTIGIIGKHSDSRIVDTLSKLVHFLAQDNYSIHVDLKCAHLLNIDFVKPCNIKQLAQSCDLIIAVGGDGTFLSAMRAIVDTDTPLFGINLGRLGFLVDISPDEMQLKLSNILNGMFIAENRFLLHTKIVREDEVIQQEYAVNEVAIHRWVTPSMIEIVTHIDGIYLNSQRSDGLIISTPTGSTAYSLSAGGPIIHPSLNALVLVPISPHTLSNRPIVIDDSSKIEISFCQNKQINALVSCDHLEIPEVLISDKIVISKHPTPIKILHPEDLDYFHILREKLGWSSGYHIQSQQSVNR
ncbi:MAG: NAD(+) kinase [Methylococcales symbiont of Hymedesmia sp. n. MRB-2018]|nr:MAG: NAD(+) kinase [Methylococcales symbiont of Hymedesmia sp. n. MRB-2018]KAF3982991.1 MAG: NAD(+) kinase [Methylococcales symbiont of Hymedesmia sp. n. MRB-2018]